MFMTPAKPGSVCWRDKNGECRNTTDVWQVPGMQAAVAAGMKYVRVPSRKG